MKEKIYVPPIKIQGIKTKIVPLIQKNIVIDESTVWIEPFMGSGVVGFNVGPRRAVFADINPYIIDFYRGIQDRTITSHRVAAFLEENGRLLEQYDNSYYYEVRDRFNRDHNPLDFLFLNRSCFNGMIRFNKRYEFNVPYGHKPHRFAKAYITKIVNQVRHVEQCVSQYDWTFLCQPFEDTIRLAGENSFIYCDPPYVGRHVDYYDSWDEQSERRLCRALQQSGARFMLSTWDHNQYRQNPYLSTLWGFCHKTTKEHFYFVGAKETNRNAMLEALLTNYEPDGVSNTLLHEDEQIRLAI